MKIRNIFSSQQPELPFPKPEDEAARRVELARTAEAKIHCAQAASALHLRAPYIEGMLDKEINNGAFNYTVTLHHGRDSFAKIDLEALEKDKAYAAILEVCKRRNWFVEMKIVPAQGAWTGPKTVLYVDFARGFSPKVQSPNIVLT